MAIHLRILSWALIFLLQLRFPPGKSIAKLNTCGPGKGSALVSKSTHNQQIKHVWWGVFKDVLKNYHKVFLLMEDLNILDS